VHRGADVLFAAGGATAQAALRAASEAGIYAIGTERDQAKALGASGTGVVTSIYGQAGFEVQRMLRLIREGNALQTASGQFGYVPLDQTYPESLGITLNSLIKDLMSGEVQTNVLLQKP